MTTTHQPDTPTDEHSVQDIQIGGVDLPVSAYDPNLGTAAEDIQNTIHRDLSPLGTVEKINGVIAPTFKHGMVLDGVEVVVRNPRLRIPVVFTVEWDDGLVYRNSLGGVYAPRAVSYDEELSRQHIDAFFGVLDAHPVFQKQHKHVERPAKDQRSRHSFSRLTRLDLIFMGTQMLGATLAMALILGSGWPDLLRGAGAIILLFGSLLLTVPLMDLSQSITHRRINKKPTSTRGITTVVRDLDAEAGHRCAWNDNGPSVLQDALGDAARTATVMDSLLDECERSGLVFTGGLTLPKLGAGLDEMNRMVDANYIGRTILHRPVVRFDAKSAATDLPLDNCFFDGHRIYRVFFNDDYRPTKVTPL